jgi:hypothetical protein
MARQRVSETKFTDPRIPAMLELVLSVYALKVLQQDNTLLYESGFFVQGSNHLLYETYNAQLKKMRPHVIRLVEIEDLDEEFWNLSTIGNRYGDIYETQLEVAKNSRLNTGSPPPYYERLMKPLIQGGHAKL